MASANKPADKACLVLVTLIEPKYKAKTYMVVSVHPCKLDASLPTKESGPYKSKILLIMAKDAVPEMGLTIAIGKTLTGIFRASKTGLK